jgi:hypothetical protein
MYRKCRSGARGSQRQQKNIADRRDIFRAKPIVRRLIIGKGIHGRGKRQHKEIEAAEDQVGAHLSPAGRIIDHLKVYIWIS